MLVLLALVPVVWWTIRNMRRRPAIRFAGVERVRSGQTGWAARSRWVLPALRCATIALIVLAIARPQKADEQTRVQTEGVAIQLVVDRSGSMSRQDFVDEDGSAQSRLDAVKGVVRNFVKGDG